MANLRTQPCDRDQQEQPMIPVMSIILEEPKAIKIDTGINYIKHFKEALTAVFITLDTNAREGQYKKPDNIPDGYSCKNSHKILANQIPTAH